MRLAITIPVLCCLLIMSTLLNIIYYEHDEEDYCQSPDWGSTITMRGLVDPPPPVEVPLPTPTLD